MLNPMNTGSSEAWNRQSFASRKARGRWGTIGKIGLGRCLYGAPPGDGCPWVPSIFTSHNLFHNRVRGSMVTTFRPFSVTKSSNFSGFNESATIVSGASKTRNLLLPGPKERKEQEQVAGLTGAWIRVVKCACKHNSAL